MRIRKNMPFHLLPWTVEDWKDFHYTLKAFKERVRRRHAVRVSGFKEPDSKTPYIVGVDLGEQRDISNLERTCRGMEVEG